MCFYSPLLLHLSLQHQATAKRLLTSLPSSRSPLSETSLIYSLSSDKQRAGNYQVTWEQFPLFCNFTPSSPCFHSSLNPLKCDFCSVFSFLWWERGPVATYFISLLHESPVLSMQVFVSLVGFFFSFFAYCVKLHVVKCLFAFFPLILFVSLSFFLLILSIYHFQDIFSA